MDSGMYGFLGTLIGAIVGASASIGATFIHSWQNSRIQIKGDDLQRVERARIFQRETLLRVQECIQDAMRNANQVHLLDIKLYKQTRSWQTSLLGEELDQKVLNVNRELSMLTERISNDDLRNEINELRTILTSCLLSSSEEDSEYKLNIAMQKWQQVMEHIGKVLREYY